MKYKITAVTNVGLVRANNEDNFIVCPDLADSSWFLPEDADLQYEASGAGCLLCVADGMGGMNAGEVASGIAVDCIQKVFSDKDTLQKIISGKPEQTESFMKRAVTFADKTIKQWAENNPDSAGMGTTIVMAWVRDSVAHIAWCGDSRAYLINPQVGLSRLSKDHSLVQQLVDSGQLDPDLAIYHPNSNVITRSLGDSPVKAQPDYVSKQLCAGDIVLLCSDGLCGICQDGEILNTVLDNADNIDKCKNSLIDLALSNGGTDNVTVALFRCMEIEGEMLNKTLPVAANKSFRHKFFRWK